MEHVGGWKALLQAEVGVPAAPAAEAAEAAEVAEVAEVAAVGAEVAVGVPAQAAEACCVCLGASRTVLLLPCRHLCLCAGCAGQVGCCPLCRGAIAARVAVFL